MATYTSAATGLWSAGATWSGGIKPPSAAGHKIVIASPHVVEYDEAAGEYGDDSATGFTINSGGTLKASRTKTTSLTVRGTFTNSGTVDYGTEADPIPAAYTATIVGNYSTSLANAKYAITSSGTPTWKMWGATRTRLAELTASAIITDTTFAVDDATGWAVSDMLVFGPPSNSSTAIAARAITGISGLNITVGAALSEASSAGRHVINISSNVRVTGHTPQTYQQATKTLSSTAASAFEIGHVEFVGGGNAAASNLLVSASGSAGIVAIDSIVCHNIVSVSGSTVTTCPVRPAAPQFNCSLGASGVAVGVVAVNYNVGGTARGLGVNEGASASFSAPILAGCAAPIGSANSATPAVIDVSDATILGASAALFGVSGGASQSTGLIVRMTGGTCAGLARIAGADSNSIGKAEFIGVDFGGGSSGVSTMNDPLLGVDSTFVSSAKFDRCSFPSNFAVPRAVALADTSSLTDLLFLSVNNDPTDQRRYTRGGEMTRENAVVNRGTSSVRMDCWFTGVAQTYSYEVTVAAGETLHLIGSMRYTSTYGTATPPKVTISGLGITPVVATCPTSGANTWHDYEITVTNPQSYTGKFTVTLTGQSTADTAQAYCYFDGHVDPPWIDQVRHFGYLYNNSASLVDDPTITISEAAALALAVSVDHDYQIITVSGAITNAEVFQACMADLAQTSSLYPTLIPVHISSDDGEDFTTTYDVVFDVGSPTSIITGPYTDAAGRHVLIEAPALVSGSRVQIYNVTTATELYNGVLSGVGLSIAATWSTNETIRLRSDHEDKLPLTALGVLTSSGLEFLDIQEDDTVYADNAIDGSTCDVSVGGEFDADGANVQIDIDDVDGVTSVQRLYAWIQWYQTTAIGIASDFFGAMEAPDSANYIIDQSLVDIKLDNVSAVPVRIIGGYLSRLDGSTVIAPGSGSIQMDPGKAYTASDIGAAVTRTEKWLRNKRVTNPSTGTQTVYDDDDVTVLGSGALYEDVAGTQAYRGQGADRADRLA